MKRLHVGMVCDEYPPVPHGGIGSVVSDLAEGLADRGHHVTVVGCYPSNQLPGGQAVEEFLNNVRVVRLKNPPEILRYRPGSLVQRLLIRSWLEFEHLQNPFDIVEWPDYGGMMPWGLKCCPSVVRLHGSNKFFDEELRRTSSPFEHGLEKGTIRAASFIFSVSEYAAEQTMNLVGLGGQPYSLVYNAVNTSTFSPSPDVSTEPGRIVFVNSLSPKKGIEELCEAANIVFAQVPHATLVIVGRAVRIMEDGRPYKDHLLDRVRPEFKHRVTFTGVLGRNTGVVEQLRRAQVACLPSQLETFGIAAVEAMAVGKPVVFSKTGPGPEIIEHGVNGLLCDPMRPEDIAEKLLQLLNDPALCESMGKLARQHVVERFDREDWIDRNIANYRECISAANAGREKLVEA